MGPKTGGVRHRSVAIGMEVADMALVSRFPKLLCWGWIGEFGGRIWPLWSGRSTWCQMD